jgi:hypothetical protein
MKRFALVIGLVACVVAGAWAADVVVNRAEFSPSAVEVPGFDGTVELKWDNGTTYWWLAWYTGADMWVGCDFDVSTIKTYGGLKTMRVRLRSDWPNTGWDGGRIAVYSFAGGVPGAMIWPTSGNPRFVMPTGANGAWQDFDVSWVLPGIKKFLPAWEQFYDHPACDPFATDNSTIFSGHSWLYSSGSWQPYQVTGVTAPYRNVCVRMIVDNEQNPAIAPSSIGRVKALYF